ncbi:MAG TPA: sigma 54-interacting transcriptional regulator [Kofleriaceae bacterium]|nr:sigma 54-interacting transcriptional regulator [Kofleriaceae bacterium]
MSPPIVALHRRLDAIARAERTTLITGPTGAGKDVVARSLHERSRRAGKPFVAVQCAALPDNLVEAELFGHSRGAFTGAVQARDGLVRTAELGTLFLDDVDSLALGAQAKLLRFLETGEFRAVGADHCETSRAWVVAATNQDLHARVRTGAFREDLLYRLEVVRVAIPPLRERRDDIVVLAEHFLVELGQGHKHLTGPARAALESHDWPGNVRELRHRIEAAALLGESDAIEIDDLGLGLSSACGDAAPTIAALAAALGLEGELWRLVSDQGMSLAQATATCEEMLVRAALRAEGHNRTRAAARLGINVRTIYKKLPR